MTQSGQGEEPSARTAREGIVLPSDGGEPLLPGMTGTPAPVHPAGVPPGPFPARVTAVAGVSAVLPVLVVLVVRPEAARPLHTAPRYPGGVPVSWAVERSWRPRRSRRRASSSVTPRSAAVWR